jgi:methionyl-tRNA synthetase
MKYENKESVTCPKCSGDGCDVCSGSGKVAKTNENTRWYRRMKRKHGNK